MKSATQLESIFPVYKVGNDCILSKSGDITVAFEATLPEIFTLSDQEYEAFHHALVKAIKVLPGNSIFHKQDWFLGREFEGFVEDKVLSFLSHSSEKFFNERSYLDHTCYIMITRKLNDQRQASSLCSTLTKRNIVPEESINEQKVQEFLDTASQFERILQDSGFVAMRRVRESR